MTKRSAGDSRSHSRRIGRLLCGLVATIAVLAGVVVAASARSASRNPSAHAAVANPELTVGCGLKVALVLDESQSISNGTGGFAATEQVRNAATAFTLALEGTGSPLALTSFHSIGFLGVPYQEVTPGNITTFTNWIGTGPDSNNPGGYNPPTSVDLSNTAAGQPNGTTNWQDGFQQVLDATRTPSASGVPPGAPDLVVFVTDGNPNTVGGPDRSLATSPGPTDGTGRTRWLSNSEADRNLATDAAVRVANQLKAHSRIFGIFVGPDTQEHGSTTRIQRVSGTREGLNPIRDDYAILPKFDELKGAMNEIVARLCGSTLDITKQVPGNNGEVVNASGWTFKATLDPAGGHTWLEPTHGINGSTTEASARVTTGADGIARFAWTLHKAENHVDVAAVKETEKGGFHFVSARCRTDGPDGQGPWTNPSAEGIPGPATLGQEEYRVCYVLNRSSMAQLTVVKHLEPDGDPGRFNLHIGSQVVTTPPGNVPPGSLTVNLPASGHHTVMETGALGTDLTHYNTTLRCVDLAHPDVAIVHPPEGTLEASVPLTHDGQHVVCTFTNVSNQIGEITVIKHLIPAGSGTFNLHIGDNSTPHPVGDGGRLGPIPLRFGSHDVSETAGSGTDLSHFNVSTTCINENTGRQVAHNAHGPNVSVDLNQADNQIQCTITNERPGVKVGRLEVVKHLVPHDDAGSFDLLIGGKVFAAGVGHNGSTGPLDFELGSHAVTEQGARGTRLADFSISTTCVDKAHGGHQVAHNAHGPSVTVHLNSESDNIVCTITNTRTIAPPEEGDVQPQPGPGPHLAVFKSMPQHASVGALVPITISVHNHGRGTAHGVQLLEKRPPGLQIVHVANGGGLHNGSAMWDLGNLAPGEVRTVHATARVVHTGRHVDTAVATAINANAALSVASVRARAAARRPRPPTPPPPVVTG